MKLTYGKCINCGKKIPFENFVCENCYHIYFMRVREYLEKHPLSDMLEIKKGTNLPQELINLFYENGDIEEAKVQMNNIKEQELASIEQDNKHMNKLKLAMELQQEIKSDSVHKVVEVKPMMRFLKSNTKK